MSVPKKVNIFTYLNQIYNKTQKETYDKKIGSAYLLSLWLSHSKELIPIVQKINSLQFYLPDDLIYKYYFNKVPKGKRFIKWTKKAEVDKKETKIIDEIISEYGVSKREAKMLMQHKKEI